MSPERRRVVAQAPGKINLSLHVGAVDHRGYHALATVFQAVDLMETVTAQAADDLHLTVTSHVDGDVPTDGTNLALRAARLLQQEHRITAGAALHIDKTVPVAGGMGGGSADAAAALVALNRLWELDLEPAALRELGGRLGADVPFALTGHTALGRGNGDDLSPLLVTGEWHWVLAVPGGHLSTPEVYRTHDELVRQAGREPAAVPEPDDRQVQALRSADVALLGETLHNDLQAAAFHLRPGLAPVCELAEGSGAYGALVSGSGPTIAVLAGDADHAAQLAALLRAEGVAQQCLTTTGSAPGARVISEE
ncbi:4-(cytidine 5'-diphospho)-2-C-methyl-D-erythritol kinase [Brachybacterium sp. EF45031]|nr:4-(cytidine 5'-diphospho)-2-C-methyl-D-erythritol kinase [Brachybacterium sillae]